MNLFFTEIIDEKTVVQHNCLGINPYYAEIRGYFEIVSYCLSELPSEFIIDERYLTSKYTFNELAHQNITTEQLYSWSAAIDLIEQYQFYLDHENLLFEQQIFYNCTLPRFGSKCQYELHYYDHSLDSNLNEMIHEFYSTYFREISTDISCYIHLTCRRACLDWREICDGIIDCIDDRIDEEHCWQLEINECRADEHRCINGQCIPRVFFDDLLGTTDCLDTSDERRLSFFTGPICMRYDGPSMICEDVTCNEILDPNDCWRKKVRLPLVEFDLDDCWSAVKCILELSGSLICQELLRKTCPERIYLPSIGGLIDEIEFVYLKNDLVNPENSNFRSYYICYNNTRYNFDFINLSKTSFDGRICVHSKEIGLSDMYSDSMYSYLQTLRRYRLIYNYTSTICNRTTMYSCRNSLKCISIYRLMDKVFDCPLKDDENLTSIIELNYVDRLNRTHFVCSMNRKYIPRIFLWNGRCDCEPDEGMFCEDEDLEFSYIKSNVFFQYICDGYTDMLPIRINGQYETDETNCQHWQCDNVYTHCNRIWNCPDARDEIDCDDDDLILNCSSKFHICASIESNRLECLPSEKLNDGRVDCLSMTDEPNLYGGRIQSKQLYDIRPYVFYCKIQGNISSIDKVYLCDGFNHCQNGEDEQFCTTTEDNSTPMCHRSDDFQSKIERFLCKHTTPHRFWLLKQFRMPETISSASKVNLLTASTRSDQQIDLFCHRGLSLRVWLYTKYNLTRDTCLCPPSYYGPRCEYQNQRISLTLQFRTLSNSWETIFIIVVSLIDHTNQRLIHSFEQITYLPTKFCEKKFNFNLLYSTRPKNHSKHYGIHIDFFEKLSLVYRGSVYLPVQYSFLPVQRIVSIIYIPNHQQHSSNTKCTHGRYVKYWNHPENLTFCQCDRGWSGKYCHIPYQCMCSSDSLCLGVSTDHRPICVCPMNRFGPRCLLTDRICQHSTCQNHGQCISNTNYKVSNENEFLCICHKGFSGQQCEIANNQLRITFDENLVLSENIFIHFIDFFGRPAESLEITTRATTFRTVPSQNETLVIYWSQIFHLVIIESLQKHYYLTVLQSNYNRSAIITKHLQTSDRCLNISELFNSTLIQFNLLLRMKFYHMPCQNQSLNLKCFFDELHFCLCYEQFGRRQVNCLKFDHHMKFDCFGRGECENQAQCLQDHPTCPQKFLCVCPSCYFGRRCQFHTGVFGLSLDAILGYRILSKNSLTNQPLIIQISLTLSIVFILAGLMNSLLSIVVFRQKSICEVGCGLYLLCSSMNTLLLTMICGLKFFILLCAQMSLIGSQLFLSIQCYSLDFLVRICLSMDQWFGACVAIERVVTSIKGANFNKRKSKQTAKRIIILLFIIVISTFIHDPIHRRLIDEENEIDDQKRIWCITTYSSTLRTYNSIIGTFHFLGPFLINFISILVLIRIQTNRRAVVQPQQTYRGHLQKQLYQHKHLLLAPIIFILLALPRIILTLISKCMQSIDDAWIFLIAYFNSLIPSILTFVLYVLPSKFYMREFRKIIVQHRSMICRVS